MSLVAEFLPYIEIILSVVLVTAILLQQSSAGVGGALGGDSGGSLHHTRRGFERLLFYVTIICAILFAVLALISIVVKA